MFDGREVGADVVIVPRASESCQDRVSQTHWQGLENLEFASNTIRQLADQKIETIWQIITI